MRREGMVAVLCSILITGYTGYMVLDTFVVKDVYETNAGQYSKDAFDSALNKVGGTESGNNKESTENGGNTESTESTEKSAPELSGNSGSDDSSGRAANSGSDTSAGQSSGHWGHGRGGHRRKSDFTDTSSNDSSPTTTTDQGSSTYESYKDEHISIQVKEERVNDTQVYVADIQVSSPEYVKTAFANDSYGKNVTAKTSEIAGDNQAILAINGDYYGAQESGYVIRNGKIYRDTAGSVEEICCIYADGTMEIKNAGEVTAKELIDAGVWQAFSFGPALVADGSVSVDASDEVGKAMASNPRTAIGMISKNHYVFVVSDGRTSESEGLSLQRLAEYMKTLGVSCAYNLDGGGSSTMYYRGQVINNPTTTGNIKERSVSDIVYIGS